jgi:cytochrome P450
MVKRRSSLIQNRLKEWSDKYGPIFSLKIGRGTLIVLNDRRAVHDLIDKRSATYSDRPMDEQVETALSDNFAFLPANRVWRAQRKIASQLLAPKSLDEKVAPIQEAEWVWECAEKSTCSDMEQN